MTHKNDDDFLERLGAIKTEVPVTEHKICAVEVQIIESERGWGSKVDETKVFNNLADAEAFVDGFNSKNDKDSVPDWYMYAQITKRIGC